MMQNSKRLLLLAALMAITGCERCNSEHQPHEHADDHEHEHADDHEHEHDAESHGEH